MKTNNFPERSFETLGRMLRAARSGFYFSEFYNLYLRFSNGMSPNTYRVDICSPNRLDDTCWGDGAGSYLEIKNPRELSIVISGMKVDLNIFRGKSMKTSFVINNRGRVVVEDGE